jgi:hypothetical protein
MSDFKEFSVDDRNDFAASKGFRVTNHQLSPEARHTRKTGTPSEKATDYITQKKATKKHQKYTKGEETAIKEASKMSKVLKTDAPLRKFCLAHGRNLLAVKLKARRLGG